MNNADIAETIATDHGLTKADAKEIMDAVFVAIGHASAKGDEISLPGFGKFKDSPAREGRNPANGETIQIAASKKLTFAPATRQRSCPRSSGPLHLFSRRDGGVSRCHWRP